MSNPVAWAVCFDSGEVFRVVADREEADRLAANCLTVQPLHLPGADNRFVPENESVGGLLNRIGTFIDQTDPWLSQYADREFKINTPEQKNARKALKELRKRLVPLTQTTPQPTGT